MKSHFAKFIVEESSVNFYAWRLIEDGFFSPLIKKYCGKRLKIAIMKIENDTGHWAPDIKNWFELGKGVLKRLEKNTLQVNELLDEHLKVGARLYELCDLMAKKDLAKVKNKEFIKWFKDMWANFTYLSALGLIPVISDHEHFYLASRLTQILKSKNIKTEKIQDYLNILLICSRSTVFLKEKIDFFSLLRKYKNIKKLERSKEFGKHVKKYFWINYGYSGPIWTEKDFIARAKNIFNEAAIGKQYIEQKNFLKNIKNKQARLTRELRLDDKEKRFFETARLFVFLKIYRVEIRYWLHYVNDQIFKELGKRFSMPVYFFQYALKKEILDVLSGKKMNVGEILARKKAMLTVADRKGTKFIKKEKIDSFLKQVLIKEEIKKSKIITGQTAFLGKITGIVKIVLHVDDIKKVNSGDILVANQTNPNFLPAMVKAAAFVTDVGGITSHAAIVSREFKKPCIIGTKIATKVLRDRDVVEVDAIKGVVKKLN